MEFVDDRTPEQKKTHRYLVIMTDRFMSGWGKARGGASYAAWACTPDDYPKVLRWVESRDDAMRVRFSLSGWRPKPQYCAHAHIYVVTEGHNSLK